MGLLFKKNEGKPGKHPNARCPKCESLNVRVVGGGPEPFSSPMLPEVLGQTHAWVNDYRCLDCGYRWSDWE